MPISVASLSVNEQTFSPEWNGQSFSVTYRPRVFTSKFQRDYREFYARPDVGDADAVAWWLARVVVKWDVLGDDGQPLPLSEDWLAGQDVVDVQFLWGVVTLIQMDRVPKVKTPLSNGVQYVATSSLA